MLESSQKLRELDLFERKLRLSPNGFLYNPLKFSLPDGDIAVIDDLFSFREYNNLMRHFAAAGAIGNPQPGVIQYYTGTKLWKGHDGVDWKEIFSENTPATGTGSIVRANAPTGVGQWTIPTIDLTGGQIAFPAGAVPSADPNTIDDYEEGEATVYVYDASTGGNQGSSGTLFYTKIGNRVFIQIEFVGIDTTGLTGGNVLYLRELPFAVSAKNHTASVFTDNITFSGNYIIAKIHGVTTAVSLITITTAAPDASLTVAAYTDDNADVGITGHYSV